MGYGHFSSLTVGVAPFLDLWRNSNEVASIVDRLVGRPAPLLRGYHVAMQVPKHARSALAGMAGKIPHFDVVALDWVPVHEQIHVRVAVAGAIAQVIQSQVRLAAARQGTLEGFDDTHPRVCAQRVLARSFRSRYRNNRPIPSWNGHKPLSILMAQVGLSPHTVALASDNTSRVRPALLLVRVFA